MPALFEGRARKEALATLGQTNRSCQTDPSADQDVADRTHDNLQFASLSPSYDRIHFDNVCPIPESESPEASAETEKCQNELPPVAAETESASAETISKNQRANGKKRSGTLPLPSLARIPPKKIKQKPLRAALCRAA